MTVLGLLTCNDCRQPVDRPADSAFYCSACLPKLPEKFTCERCKQLGLSETHLKVAIGVYFPDKPETSLCNVHAYEWMQNEVSKQYKVVSIDRLGDEFRIVNNYKSIV